MEERIKFLKNMTDGDEFLSLKTATQALYLVLALSADEEGFTNQVILSMHKTGTDDDNFDELKEIELVEEVVGGILILGLPKIKNAKGD